MRRNAWNKYQTTTLDLKCVFDGEETVRHTILLIDRDSAQVRQRHRIERSKVQHNERSTLSL